MGFSKKDLGDVVWSSKTGRDPVFLTSRPKDIDYPQLLSIQTLDRRTTGATLFQMERRPFICSGLVQAETAYRRTNTDVSGTARASSTLPTRCRSFLRDDPIGAVLGHNTIVVRPAAFSSAVNAIRLVGGQVHPVHAQIFLKVVDCVNGGGGGVWHVPNVARALCTTSREHGSTSRHSVTLSSMKTNPIPVSVERLLLTP